jgi:hypothetical protein
MWSSMHIHTAIRPTAKRIGSLVFLLTNRAHPGEFAACGNGSGTTSSPKRNKAVESARFADEEGRACSFKPSDAARSLADSLPGVTGCAGCAACLHYAAVGCCPALPGRQRTPDGVLRLKTVVPTRQRDAHDVRAVDPQGAESSGARCPALCYSSCLVATAMRPSYSNQQTTEPSARSKSPVLAHFARSFAVPAIGKRRRDLDSRRVATCGLRSTPQAMFVAQRQAKSLAIPPTNLDANTRASRT